MADDPIPAPAPSSSSRSARAAELPDPVPTTGAPDAPAVENAAPVTKKRAVNDGPTGRARRELSSAETADVPTPE